MIDKNADLRGSPSLSMWISPIITTLSELTTKLERKSANSSKKQLYGPGGLYTVTRIKLTVFFVWICKTENEHFKKVKFEAIFQSSMEIRIIYSSNTPSTTRQTGNVSITVGRGGRLRQYIHQF